MKENIKAIDNDFGEDMIKNTNETRIATIKIPSEVKKEVIRLARLKLQNVEGAVVDFFARVEPCSESGKEGWWVEASVWVDKVEDCDES